MPSPSKIKGSGWERDVAKFLTNLYGENFIRAPGSGSYTGGSNKSRREVLHEGQIRSFKGDIVPGQSFPLLNIECKFYADFPFHLLYSGESKILEEWLGQLLDAADPGDYSVLIMKFNRKGKYVAVRCNDEITKDAKNYFVYTSKDYGSWIIQGFDIFWKNNKEKVKKYSKKN